MLHGDTRGTPPPGADGITGPANKWPEVDPGTTWKDYGPRLQVPLGYKLNEGANYIPFDIRLPSGKLQPAKYIKLKYSEDPLMYGMIDGDPHQYVESFQATPFPLAGPLHTYTLSQLKFFEDDHDLCPEVDSAMYHLYDKSVLAEVKCYWTNKKKLKREYEELWQVQHDIWKRKLTLGGCARHMAGAWVLQRIGAVNDPGCVSSWTSIRLVAVDVNPKRGVMLRFDRTSPTMQIHRTASFLSPSSLHRSRCTIWIWFGSCV